MKQTDIDCLAHRKSTHLAGVDVETIIHENGSCIVTIKNAYYTDAENVAGKTIPAYVIEFEEPIKSMVLNTTNRRIIANNVKLLKQLSSVESRNLKNWVGVKIELTFDPSVKMKGQVVGGIRVKMNFANYSINVNETKQKLSKAGSLDQLVDVWKSLSKSEKTHPAIINHKNELKNKLS